MATRLMTYRQVVIALTSRKTTGDADEMRHRGVGRRPGGALGTQVRPQLVEPPTGRGVVHQIPQLGGHERRVLRALPLGPTSVGPQRGFSACLAALMTFWASAPYTADSDRAFQTRR